MPAAAAALLFLGRRTQKAQTCTCGCSLSFGQGVRRAGGEFAASMRVRYRQIGHGSHILLDSQKLF